MHIFFAEQVIIYNVGLLASQFYVVLGEKDFEGFIRHTLYSLVLIVAIAFVSSLQTMIQANCENFISLFRRLKPQGSI